MKIVVLLGALLLSQADPAAVFPGHIQVWGDNFFGEASPPPLDDVVAIAAGLGHALAVRSNGTVVAWGYGEQGQTNVPPGLTNVIAVSARLHSVALKSDGTVVTWGSNAPEVTNTPPGLSNVIQVAAGGWGDGNAFTLALRADGTIVAWGLLQNGGTPPAGLSNITQISAGGSFALGLTRSGTVTVWGAPGNTIVNGAVGLSDVIGVRGGQTTAFVIKSDFTLRKWGGSFDSNDIPAGVTGIKDVSLGNQHVIALRTNGTVLAWGYDGAGQNDIPKALTGAEAVAAGGNYSLVLIRGPRLPPPVISSQPQDLTVYRGELATLSVGASGSAALSYQWFKESNEISGATNSTYSFSTTGGEDSGLYKVQIVDSAGGISTSATANIRVIDPRFRTVSLHSAGDISISSGSANPKGSATILAGTRRNGTFGRGLIRFDLPGIPSNAVIENAALRLTVVMEPRAPGGTTFSLHRLLKPWSNAANWNDATAKTSWAAPGAAPGIDYVAAGITGISLFESSDALLNDLRAWIANPAVNYGWILISDAESSPASARHFGSSISATPPQLDFLYSVSTTPAAFTRPRVLGASTFRFELAGEAGWLYAIETRKEVNTGNWSLLTNAPAGNALSPIIIDAPLTDSHQFFRAFAH